MDPKMDSGVSMPAQDSAMEDFDPLLYTLPEEIVAIMDEMLCHKVYFIEAKIYGLLIACR